MAILSSNAIKIAEKRYFQTPVEDWEKLSIRNGVENSKVENNPLMYRDKFIQMIFDMDFIPAGRILRNIGKSRGSLFNCYVLPLYDSIEDIGQFIKECLIVWSEGGGIGTNLSFLRPENAIIRSKGGESSGPVSFLKIADAAADTIKIGGQRRAAGLALMNANHPDIFKFIDAKMVHKEFNNFNISVGVSEDFLNGVEKDGDWDLTFNHQVYQSVKAKDIWNKIIYNMVNHAEPGLINWDNLRSNNSYYFSPVVATNPCGEACLEQYGICNLGSLVVSNFVTPGGNTNWKKMEETIRLAVRFLDNIIDINRYVLPQFDKNAHDSRRIGIGVMGLAEYFFSKKIRYGSEKSIQEAERLMKFIRDTSYDESIKLASEKGSFAKFDPIEFSKAHFVRSLSASTRMAIKKNGMRNVTTMAIAPTGCQVKETIIVTNDGILTLDEIKKTDEQWQNIDLKVSQEVCGREEIATRFYINGNAKTKKITLSSGIVLEGTYNHQYRILDGENYIWKRIDELKIDDDIVSVLNSYNKKTEPTLKTVELSHFNQNKIKEITSMNEKLAEFLGIYFGDGSNHEKGIRINCNALDEEEYTYVAELGEELFGIKPTFDNNGRNCNSVCFNSKLLLQFFEVNGLLKNKSKEMNIPKIIRCSSKKSLTSFIEGLWFADGSRSGNNFYIDTASYDAAKQLAVIIRAIGKDVKIQKHVSGLGSDMFRIHMKHNVYKFRPKKDQLKRSIMINLGLSNCVLDKIVNIEESENMTYDIEVPNTVTYLANSVVSHNTISLVADVTSSIEPLPFKAYKRNDRVGERYYIHQIYKDLLLSGGDVPDWFVDTSDLEPKDHLEIQSIVQKYTDGAVSKTINMPKGTTEDQLSSLLLEYIRDLKGCTVYVDGSREGQILNNIPKEEVLNYLNESTSDIDEETTKCTNGKCSI